MTTTDLGLVKAQADGLFQRKRMAAFAIPAVITV